MSNSEGAKTDLKQLLRSLGKEALLREADAANLSPKGGRLRCPFKGCSDKPLKDRRHNVVIYAGKDGVFRLKCHACGAGGSLVDLLAATKGWTDKEAIAHLVGLPTPPPRPPLHVVPSEPAPSDATKLDPKEIQQTWDALAKEDAVAEEYLAKRGLGESLDLGLVRFASNGHPKKKVRDRAFTEHTIAMLLKDCTGLARGIQFRLRREPRGDEPKTKLLAGSSPKVGFFGSPERIEESAVICVVEGLADTLTLEHWTATQDVIVVGACSAQVAPAIADELARLGIAIEGKIFALFPQNDIPKRTSRRQFDMLAQRLTKLGATVVMVPTPNEYKDVGDWYRAAPDTHWPPPALAKVLGDLVEHDSAATKFVVPDGGGLPIPALFEVDFPKQDFSTLLALLDHPVHREAILGRAGEYSLNEMDSSVWYGDVEIKASDISRIRYGLEQQARSTEGKALKFGALDIGDALLLLGRRKIIHPLRDWLLSLPWKGGHLLEEELPLRLGHQPNSLEAVLLQKWFVGIVARAIKPGSKFDNCLVLVGPEGILKSTFFEAIGGKWFTDEQVNQESGKDGKMITRKKWIIEWAELVAMSRAKSPESVKSHLSQREDLFRPPYGRGLIEAPRHCVFVGSTNRRQFLEEANGNRRFWPVWTDRIDVEWVREHRDQLLAQAVAAFQAGVKWWLEPEWEEQLRKHNRKHQREEPWLELVEEYVAEQKPAALSTRTILEAIVKKPAAQWTEADHRRAANTLKAMGWEPTEDRRAGGFIGRWWVPGTEERSSDRFGGS